MNGGDEGVVVAGICSYKKKSWNIKFASSLQQIVEHAFCHPPFLIWL
jgi:hypothetical protein